MSRWVMVDDTDPEILYSGPWFQDVGSLNGLGNYGSPYQDTSHGIDANGNFSYSFQGIGVIVAGSVLFPTSSQSPTSNPSWACSVDGSTIPTNPNTIAGNRLKLCGTESLSEGLHDITVEVTSSDQHTFWLDYIRYLPLPGVNTDNASLRIDTSDPQINYGPGWKTYNGNFLPGQLTQQTGSILSFVFQGASLLWLGFYDNSLPSEATTATYSVDGTAAQVAGAVQYNLPFFQTPELSSGNHTIQVVYQGDAQTAPLSLLYFETNQGSSGRMSTTSASEFKATSSQLSSPLPSISSTTQAVASYGLSSHLSKSSNTGADIGGALGGLALLVSILVAIFTFLRSRRRRPESPKDAVVDPFYLDPSPTLLGNATTGARNQGHDFVSNLSAPAATRYGRLGTPVARIFQTSKNTPEARGPANSYFVPNGSSPSTSHDTEPCPKLIRDENSELRFHGEVIESQQIVRDLPPPYVSS